MSAKGEPNKRGKTHRTVSEEFETVHMSEERQESFEPESFENESETAARRLSGRKGSRLQTLAKAVEKNGPLHLKNAATLLNVSEMTVRRDLAECEGRFGYLGGYIVAGSDSAVATGYNLKKENDKHAMLKEQACAAAASLIEDDDILFIDCGTTTPHLAELIPADKRLTVVCYALNIADILCRKPNVRVVLLGGLYHPASATFASDEAMRTLNKLRISKAFLTAGGIHPVRGVSCSHFHEVTIKRAVIGNAVTKYIVADSTKFTRVKLAHFADLHDFDGLVTDPRIRPEDRAAVMAAGVSVITI